MPSIRANKIFQLLHNNERWPYTATPSRTHKGHMKTANEMIAESQHITKPDQHHPSQRLAVKYMRCRMPQCNVNLHSIKAIKRHNVLCHPNKSVVTIMMHHVCGNTTKEGTCALSFKTETQLRKHRILKGHPGLGRGRSTIAQLLKAELEPVRATESD